MKLYTKSVVIAMLLILISTCEAYGQSIGGGLFGKYLRTNTTVAQSISGPLLLPSGNATAPAASFSAFPNVGMYAASAGYLIFAVNGVATHAVTNSGGGGVRVLNTGSYQFSSSTITATPDVALARFSAGAVRITDGSTGGGALSLLAITAPASPASGALIYIDSADNDLKIKYSDGTVVVIGNKP